jgi:hypothetical protein
MDAVRNYHRTISNKKKYKIKKIKKCKTVLNYANFSSDEKSIAFGGMWVRELGVSA